VLATISTAVDVLGAIAWNPEIRNILGLLVGVVVLLGSVYLLVGSNTGLRTGLLITLAGFCGWMMTMGVIWWIYGIGMKGTEPSWKVEELNYSATDYAGLAETTNEEARRLTALAELPSAQEILEERPELVEAILPPNLTEEEQEARARNITMGQIIEAEPEIVEELAIEETLGGWELLAQSNRQRGDAVATADAFLGEGGRGLFESSADYLVLDAFAIGGKDGLPDDPDRWDRITNELRSIFVQPLHPTHYTVVQVREVIHECDEAAGQVSTAEVPCYTVEPGEPAPTPVIDEDAPILNVVMIRDLGDKRFPAFMITLVFGSLFALTCWTLHRRDAVVAARRAATA
jgi:hypothetical protein